MAKDGHPIYGPYDGDGEIYDCNSLDICNGMISGDGYRYIAATTFPYIVGCYGPGAKMRINPRCSTNTCSFSNLNQ